MVIFNNKQNRNNPQLIACSTCFEPQTILFRFFLEAPNTLFPHILLSGHPVSLLDSLLFPLPITDPVKLNKIFHKAQYRFTLTKNSELSTYVLLIAQYSALPTPHIPQSSLRTQYFFHPTSHFLLPTFLHLSQKKLIIVCTLLCNI